MSDARQDATDLEAGTEQAAAAAEDLNLTKTLCGICGPSTKDELMIRCDGCHIWYHARCVGVPEDQVPKKFYCHEETCKKKGMEYQQKQQQRNAAKKGTRSNPTTDESDANTNRKDAVQTAGLEALERQQITGIEALEAEMRLKQKERRIQRALERRRMELDMQFRAEEEEEERAHQEYLLRQRKEQVERIKANRDSFNKQMEMLDKELNKLSTSKRAPETAKKSASDGQRPGTSGASLKKLKGSQSTPKQQFSSSDESPADDESDLSEDQNSGDEKDKSGSKPGKTNELPKDDVEEAGPTRAQLAARKGMPYKLKPFTGKSEEWPLFYASYTISNKTCGYMNHENMFRLLDCLEGPAMALVEKELVKPSAVPAAIERLRRHFGRPEQILRSLQEKVEKLTAPHDLASFVPFANTVSQLCEHMEASDMRNHLNNPLLVKSLVDKIPYPEKRDWVHYKRAYGGDLPALRVLTNWLMEFDEDACDADVNVIFDAKLKPKQQEKGSSQHGKKSQEKGAVFVHSEARSSGTSSKNRKKLNPCMVCQSTEHRLRFCDDFGKLTYDDRMKLVNREKLCKLCLNGHGGQCWLKIQCNVGNCREKHNPLLHPVGNVVALHTHIRCDSKVMYRIVPVNLHCGEKTVRVLAFLDEGSSVTLVEQKVANLLGIVGVHEPLTIKWTAEYTRVEKDSQRMNLWASGVGAAFGDKMLMQSIHTVGKLMLPRQKLDYKEIAEQYQHMRELPIESYDGRPEILVGLNNVYSFAPMEAKLSSPMEPIAVRCKLGWTVYGPRRSTTATTTVGYVGYHQEVTNEDLHELLKSHYALEESVAVIPQESAEDKRAREILERTTIRIGDRFETGLLWKTDDPKFPDSLPMAQRRLNQLERKLDRNPELRENVCKQIQEYQAKGYAHKATAEELEQTAPGKAWYLPLNVVLNPNKPGKVRLVWDAAASVQGVSLNSQLLKGPDLLVPLVKVMTGFRERRIAFGGDLKEMFHQLKIRPEDRQAQRFIFREKKGDPPSTFVMDVATFGSTSSPCSAQFVKNRNAEEFASQYPEAAEAIINRHYVDDYFDSVDSVAEAVKRAEEVRLVHKKGGFEIRNWMSNSREFLRSLGEEKLLAPVHFNMDKETGKERVLGVIWGPESDDFSFSTRHREELLAYLYEGKRPTKRLVASCVMGFFDPLGFLSQFTIHGKIMIQHLWRSKCDWDEEIDDNTWDLWKRWTGLLPEVEAVRIPRCYFGDNRSDEADSLELHVFVDASEHAYGCVAYLRAVIKGTVRCALVMSRAKVAPLKRQSIPRLELMAALLGARINRTIRDTHSLKIDRTVFWTDSRTVWSWIHSDQHKFKQFVAFRVGEIWELSNVADWFWIPTKLNIADVLTKWGQGPPLQSEGEWFNGPAFLYLPQDQWPSMEVAVEETDEEAREVVMFHDVIEAKEISRWSTLLRSTAMALRFIENCRRKKAGQPIVTVRATAKHCRMIDATKAKVVAVQEALEQSELQQAENILWRQAQWDSFPDEMSVLTSNLERKPGQPLELLKRSSVIYKYSPVLDENGVLRMDSRLANAADSPFDKRHPVILSRSHEITQKLILHYHEEFGHANSETVFNEMRQRFQIAKLRSAIQREGKRCVWCKVHKCLPVTPRMSPLPVDRVTVQQRPFSSVGLDYLGPVEVSIGRRREKRWVAVFTCLAVRAVHLEVVTSLTTESCRMAIRRFCSRFGKPLRIYSDNATCFKGVNNEMARINKECADGVVSPTTAWHFNPPGTPHMGGIWERMVRSVKEAMRALDDGRRLTDEILLTTLAEAADMINARPLTYLPQDSEEGDALTPNHFLRGTVTSADANVDDGPTDAAKALRNQYKRSQYLADNMWQRWLKEYLPSISQRTKWHEEQKPLEKDDLVFLVEGKNRKSWRRGIVEAVIKGADGRVRQADVRTADGKVQRRGVVNLAVLEVQ